MSYGLYHFELMNLSTKIAQFGVRSYELRLKQVQHYCCILCCAAAVIGLLALLLSLFWYSFTYEGRCWSMYMEIIYEVRAIVGYPECRIIGNRVKSSLLVICRVDVEVVEYDY
ncbi:uncharacterized protein LOC125492605 isoform X2 [Beta vulgaris subsp. vulgaris]|uniref:uncharacterized protein LOC125492605 isoform X2 n=1 Tax=Beta vulgaris subsp. vulgaris TaxID=3555 RepID=UPI0025480A0D|nr:uncharacterized protein LOC125492605 isoform X2 [Beta vulgaris subsp. vulgaris]